MGRQTQVTMLTALVQDWGRAVTSDRYFSDSLTKVSHPAPVDVLHGVRGCGWREFPWPVSGPRCS